MIKITPNEQYQLIDVNWKFINPDSFHKNEQVVKEALADQPNFIIDISTLEMVKGAVQMFLNDIQNEVNKADGNLIMFGGSKAVTEQLESLGYICIPSLDEAVDYIFMEQIEKMMGDDEAE